VQHSGQLDVVDEPALAAQQRPILDPLDAATYSRGRAHIALSNHLIMLTHFRFQ
jgi:hypothetical protein